MNVHPGLCGSCRNMRTVGSRRGSTFFLCDLSRVDARFPRYPRLPVLQCPGYDPVDPATLDTGAIEADPVRDVDDSTNGGRE
ncbi:MAG TPA: hypothetical protein VK929_10100 [Longimicrobiales bacterium]|nr:hypothetical protein [Longimicrobiales bacterium]